MCRRCAACSPPPFLLQRRSCKLGLAKVSLTTLSSINTSCSQPFGQDQTLMLTIPRRFDTTMTCCLVMTKMPAPCVAFTSSPTHGIALS